MPLTPEQAQECAKLKQLFVEKSELSQRAFVKKFNLGTPANLGQYLQGRRALNLKIAMVMAKALDVEVSDFSPRLAREIALLQSDTVVPYSSGLKKIPLVSFAPASPFSDVGQLEHPQSYIEKGDFVVVDEDYPDGTKVGAPHLHVYTEEYGDKFAIEVPPGMLSDVNSGIAVLNDFMKYCNIKNCQIETGLFT